MDEELAIKALDTSDKLIQRAAKIVDKAPYWAYIHGETKFAKLQILGNGTAVLRWPTAETEWDMATLECDEVSFPTRLLFISDDELATWKSEQAREYERKTAETHREQAQQREDEDRAQYEQLKARYG